MRIHQQLRYLLVLVLVCGSVALAATQWTLQPKESKLTFVGTQAGAEFQGVFERFTADLKFDPQDLAGQILELLEDAALARRLRRNARRYAEKNLSMSDYLAGYEALIENIMSEAR